MQPKKHFFISHFGDKSVVHHTDDGGQSFKQQHFYSNRVMDLNNFAKGLEKSGYEEVNPWSR